MKDHLKQITFVTDHVFTTYHIHYRHVSITHWFII